MCARVPKVSPTYYESDRSTGDRTQQTDLDLNLIRRGLEVVAEVNVEAALPIIIKIASEAATREDCEVVILE